MKVSEVNYDTVICNSEKRRQYVLFYYFCMITSIGVAPITCNKNRNIQGRSPNVVKVIFHAIRNCSQRKEFTLSGSKFFPLGEVPILKRNAIEENHCLIQLSPFDVGNVFSVLATPLTSSGANCDSHSGIKERIQQCIKLIRKDVFTLLANHMIYDLLIVFSPFLWKWSH